MWRITSGCRKDNVADKNNETTLKFILSFSAMISQTADVFCEQRGHISNMYIYCGPRKMAENLSITLAYFNWQILHFT